MFESLNKLTGWIIISTWKTTNQSPTFAGVSQSLSKPPQRIAGSGFEIAINRVPRAMPVRGLGRHWLWGNWQSEPLNSGVPVLCRHALLINVKPITAQEKFNFPRANCLPCLCTGIALGTRLDCYTGCIKKNCTDLKLLLNSQSSY
jgi:hypothetical protein